jgi:hypothetical protein
MAMDTIQSLVLPYEQRLNADRRWALNEGGWHFQKDSEVFKAMRRVATRLDALEIPYCVVGGMAMFEHGFRRFTEDVDLLVTRENLQQIHKRLDGLGYLPPFAGSKQLRDTESGVRIEFLVTGEYPGDGKPKPVVFPDPADASIELNGVKVLKLSLLIDLKLASGMTNSGRYKDLGDVQELIQSLNLTRDYAEQLNPFVQAKYVELWDGVEQGKREP